MDEIITFGSGYKLNSGIKVFVYSAKKVCKNVSIILDNPDEELSSFLNKNGVNIVSAEKLAADHNVQTNISPYTLKVIYFYIYIKNYSKASNVYLCDFTDIFFQKNPFELIVNDKPYVTSENFIIGKCQTNMTWLKICYNDDICNLISKYEILNGGNIMGNIKGATDLLNEMCSDMSHIISRIGNYQNIDQASLNKTVYFDQYRYNILNSKEILNLAHDGDADVQFNSDSIIINDNEPYVIHQYDVIKPLESFLYKEHD